MGALALLAAWTVLPQLLPPGRHLLHRPAPDFSLPVVANGDEGARVKLSELRGSVVLLDFWASWCEPCMLQARILEGLSRSRGRELVVVGINVGDDARVARRFAASEHLSYPIVLDEEGAVQTAYGAASLPWLVVVAPDGQVTRVVRGVTSQAALDDAVRAAEHRER